MSEARELKPEEKARQKIDRELELAGWQIVDRYDRAMGMGAVAIRETLLKGNLEADYMFFINGKAAALLEAKREEISLENENLRAQAENYAYQLPDRYACWEKPLNLIFISNGKKTAFKNNHDENPEYKFLKRFPRPKDVMEMMGIEDFFAGLPYLTIANPRKPSETLHKCQFDAINGVEEAFRQGEKRVLISMATGSGKTYTASMIIYRLLQYTRMKRVLFLVDRNNLGKAAEDAFHLFTRTENQKTLAENFPVEKLSGKTLDSNTNIVVGTIQRLYSLLKGESELADDQMDDQYAHREDGVDIVVPENPTLSQNEFDLIIIDECHRSIYKEWKKVLDYFSGARLIGLTATPIPETEAFFNGKVVSRYTLDQSIIDGVNLDHRVYRIKTQVSEEGAGLQEGENVEVLVKESGEVRNKIAETDRHFEKEKLNRGVIVFDQIRKVLQEYKDVVYTKMYPDREPNFDYLPKTLIFALNEAHAASIVEIVKEVFGRPEEDNKFVQQITYSAGDSDELISSFRNDKDFRVAVTVTLVATGTDIRALEVLIFMANVQSETLYVQMKGRGVRKIKNEELHNVTPNAYHKDLFFLVDAVGVTETQKSIKGISGDKKPGSEGADEEKRILNPTFKQLFELMLHGNLQDENLQLLASKLATLSHRGEPDELRNLENEHHFSPLPFAQKVMETVTADPSILPPFFSVNDENIQRKRLVEPLLNNKLAMQKVIEIAKGYLIRIEGKDEIVETSFSKEDAKASTSAFEEYVHTHKDEIEALRMIWNGESEKLSPDALLHLQKEIHRYLPTFSIQRLWNDYAVLSPEKVRPLKTDAERKALTNLIQLVRLAYNQIQSLFSLESVAAQRFELWCGQRQRSVEMTPEMKELFKKIAVYNAGSGSCTAEILVASDRSTAFKLIKSLGGIPAANETLTTLNQFILKAA